MRPLYSLRHPSTRCPTVSPYLARTPSRGSLTGERRVEERRCTGLSASPPSFSFLRRKVRRTKRIRGRDGVGPGSECIRVSRAREGVEEKSPFAPFVPLSIIFLRGNLLGSLRPHVLRVPFFLLLFLLAKEREEERETKRKKERRGGSGEPRRLMEYIMMRPAVLRRLNGRVCVLRKR